MHPAQFDPATRPPREWPLRHTLFRWTAAPRRFAPDNYELRCRIIESNGTAQPMPLPFAKSGKSNIQSVKLTVEG